MTCRRPCPEHTVCPDTPIVNSPASTTVTGACDHCWHAAEYTHAIFVPNGSHHDERCCWCGGTRCYSVAPGSEKMHGDYL